MPTLFDSHEEFSEWFSKDIESHAENKGTLNEHQLRRLHMILKPFMLRRIKRNVQHELGEKVNYQINPIGDYVMMLIIHTIRLKLRFIVI